MKSKKAKRNDKLIENWVLWKIIQVYKQEIGTEIAALDYVI